MHIDPFGVEIWMNDYENNCEFNLAETCVHSISVGDLLTLTGNSKDALEQLLPLRLGYGAIPGSDALRDAISSLYDNTSREQVIVTHGTIGANALVYQSLISRGDHVVSLVPTYQQHYSIPESLGAAVTALQLNGDNQWLPQLDELRAAVTEQTKLIALTNPNNPTGSLIDETRLRAIADIAREVGAWVLCDEVYRGTDQRGSGATASIVDVYERGISTAGMSKAFSLAGLRLGWLVGPQPVIDAVMIHRDYNTISVGVVDDRLATLALQHKHKLLARSQRITRENLEVLTDWVESEPDVSWVRPRSGTTALLCYGIDMPSREFCLELLAQTGVLFTPGSAMGIEGHVRIGFANPVEALREGLQRVSLFLASHRAIAV